MKLLTSIGFISFILLFTAFSCKPDHNNDITGGGKGGKAVIKVIPEFANYLVDTCTVYIKYGTNDAPASGVYDDSAVCAVVDTIPVATFTGLTVGLYYIYGVGYHSVGGHPPNLKGGVPCTLSKEDTLQVYLPTYPYIP